MIRTQEHKKIMRLQKVNRSKQDSFCVCDDDEYYDNTFNDISNINYSGDNNNTKSLFLARGLLKRV